MFTTQTKQAAKAATRLITPLQKMEEIELSMDGSGELGHIISGHFEDTYNEILEKVANRFGTTLKDIAIYEQECEDLVMHHMNTC